MPDKSKFEDLLERIVPAIDTSDDDKLSLEADPVPVSDALQARILEHAKVASAQLLSSTILELAHEHGEDRESLLRGASERRQAAADVLDGRSDPRKLGAAGLARMLRQAGADASELAELIAQTVAQFVVFYPQQKRPARLRVLARRAQTASRGADAPVRDPEKAREAGIGFADEVIIEFNSLPASPGQP